MVNYALSGLWSVRVRESEKVLLEASDVIGEVQRYWEALYAKRPVNLPAFERLVRAHIPKGVPEEWRSVQDYTLQDLKDAVKQAVADDKAPGSNRVTAALIAELPEPVQGLVVHAYRAILRGADVPESWHEAIIWLMPKGTATGNVDEYRQIALGQQDMRMLMTPLMRRFTAVLARKGLAADWQFGAMPGSTAAATVSLAQRRLQRGQEENHVLAFDVSKAFDTAPHGAHVPPVPSIEHWKRDQYCPVTGGNFRKSVPTCMRYASVCRLEVFESPWKDARKFWQPDRVPKRNRYR